ncbi:MAG: sugar ABC transporter permease [Chloroflexi bacterium]|nr:MAG: sugar ABC transporter permease [Chloroflexota bacterium]HEY68112.1 sugar ABC transporter permease [Thermoflexia bacterium]
MTALARQRGNWWHRWGEETLSAYLFLLPSIVIFATFVFFPLFFSFYASLTHWNLPFKPSFTGLENYHYLFTDEIGAPEFFRSIRNSFYYALGVPLNMGISLAIAVLLNQRLRGVSLFRTAYFLPTITSTAAISVIWLWIYHPADYGLLNSILLKLGFSPLRWLRDPHLAMPALILMGIWHGMGYNIVIFLAGLQSIPTTLYEAAEIDGAGGWARFWRITWPLLGPTTFYVLVIGIINSLKAFTQMHVMTEGGPLGATTTITYYLYQQAFENFAMGRASAVACVLFVILFILTLIQFKVVGSRIHYE